ncbi:MAG TPA: tyrosine-protein phosphatase [Candidatus Xenobia bacterium]
MQRVSGPPLNPRDLELQGTHNTRQLGGLPTRGGVIRPNVIFRSDALQNVTPADTSTLKGIPVRTVIDFRSQEEIDAEKAADRYQAPNRLSLPAEVPDFHLDAEDYRKLLLTMDSTIKGFFTTLAKPENYPVLYHCYSGKDRTGITTALLLMTLGTPRDVITSDYMLSQRGQTQKQVDPSWIQVVYDEVDKAGGIDKFLGARGVTQQDLYQVRRYLCQTPVARENSRGLVASA